MPKDPNFLIIIGAPKSGTTTLAHWLDQRSDMVLCANKEPRFFTDFAATDWAGPGAEAFTASLISSEKDYLRSFDAKPRAGWAIDASTDYLWCDVSAERIKAWAGRFRTKLICILRDPVERAVSEYQHTIRDGLEEKTFLESLELEEVRHAKRWQPLFYHVRRSRYAEDVARYRELFGEDLCVLGFHELFSPDTCLRKIEDYLDVPQQTIKIGARHNESYVYRNWLLARLMTSDAARQGARMLIPKEWRAPVRSKVLSATTTKFRPSEADIAAADYRLRYDLETCQSDPTIPTTDWTSLVRLPA